MQKVPPVSVVFVDDEGHLVHCNEELVGPSSSSSLSPMVQNISHQAVFVDDEGHLVHCNEELVNPSSSSSLSPTVQNISHQAAESMNDKSLARQNGRGSSVFRLTPSKLYTLMLNICAQHTHQTKTGSPQILPRVASCSLGRRHLYGSKVAVVLWKQ